MTEDQAHAAIDEAIRAMIWVTAERLGFGPCRSFGYGRFEVTRWEDVS